jgi:tRNA-Thr(GGU) m(6)t(6)A37 methyltransferase TsaA
VTEPIALSPIGRVHLRGPGKQARIEVYSRFVEGLDGVESEEHLWILYWMHRLPAEQRTLLRTHPRGDASRPRRGVFALHSPCRPNPIGMTRVRLLKREGPTLIVEGLDALDGSPVLDVKSG